MSKQTIMLGKKLFQFSSKTDWINGASRIWRLHEVTADNTTCVDQLGRIYTMGLHFAEAERDDAYPIEVFVTRPDSAPAPLTDDTRRLDALAKNSWDLRCFDMSDDDIGWRVIEHHMAKPHERTVAEVFRDDPRQAIDAAIEAAAPKKGQQ
jgi:hypothetical protein